VWLGYILVVSPEHQVDTHIFSEAFSEDGDLFGAHVHGGRLREFDSVVSPVVSPKITLITA
jgi:hypothetical protein